MRLRRRLIHAMRHLHTRIGLVSDAAKIWQMGQRRFPVIGVRATAFDDRPCNAGARRTPEVNTRTSRLATFSVAAAMLELVQGRQWTAATRESLTQTPSGRSFLGDRRRRDLRCAIVIRRSHTNRIWRMRWCGALAPSRFAPGLEVVQKMATSVARAAIGSEPKSCIKAQRQRIHLTHID